MHPQYRVYVLTNPQGRHYIGLSANVANRLAQHNAGLSKWTAKYRPWALTWQSADLDLSAARKLENQLKQQKGGRGFYQITGLAPSAHNPASAGSLVQIQPLHPI